MNPAKIPTPWSFEDFVGCTVPFSRPHYIAYNEKYRPRLALISQNTHSETKFSGGE
jgi:hypothetical protein